MELERLRAVELENAERDAIVAAYGATITCGCRHYLERLPDPADHPVIRIERRRSRQSTSRPRTQGP